MARLTVGVGLPTTMPSLDRERFLRWVRDAEQMGASSLACLDRLVYPSWEPVAALAAAAVATTRVGLMSSVLLAPLRSTAMLAKQLATVDQLSDGRLSLGVGIGRRTDDYERSGLDYGQRGAMLDRQLDELHEIWASATSASGGEKSGMIGPALCERRSSPGLLIGGQTEATLRRVTRWNAGWIAAAGLGGFAGALDFSQRLLDECSRVGRVDRPRLVVTVYTAGGPHAAQRARDYMRQYYGFLGQSQADELATHVLIQPDQLAEAHARIQNAGFDEMILLPCSADLDDLEPLARLCSIATTAAATSSSVTLD